MLFYTAVLGLQPCLGEKRERIDKNKKEALREQTPSSLIITVMRLALY